jgi:hypothetical protein
MIRKIIATTATMMLAAPAFAASAPVAQLQAVNGKVLVNQGQGFVPAQGLVALNAGDKIMVGKDSSASVVYTAANCSVDVAAATVMSIAAKAPCAEGETIGAIDSVFVHSAAADGGAGYVPIVVIGGLLVAGGTMAIALTFSDTAVSAP